MKILFCLVLILGVLVMMDSVVNSQRHHLSPASDSPAGARAQPAPAANQPLSRSQRCGHVADLMSAFALKRDKGTSKAELDNIIDTMHLPYVDAQTFHLTLAAIYEHPEATPTDVGDGSFKARMVPANTPK